MESVNMPGILKTGINFFNSDPDAVTGFERMSFRDINVEPECSGIVLCRVL